MDQQLIFAAKATDERMYGESLIDDLDIQLWNLEYGDVAAHNYQIWEYPSGKIYNIESDRELSHDDYSTPHEQKWLPTLVEVDVDRLKVKTAFEKLTE